jgi:pyruvate ferredoxin oxidoreductase beta subunit
VQDYLKLQKRFAHLFAGEGDAATIARIQKDADRNIRRFRLLPQGVAA